MGMALGGRSQLQIALCINAVFACLAVCVMVTQLTREGKFSPVFGIIGIAYLTNLCCLALGANSARVISAGFSAVVVIACVFLILARWKTDATTWVSAGLGVSFGWSAYTLYFSRSLRAEVENRSLDKF
jgi:hypothetical protein